MIRKFIGTDIWVAVALVALFAFPSLASASAVLDHANLNALTSGLVGYWTMDGATTNWTTDTTQDLSGKGNAGQMINMSTTTSPVAGKIGQALKLNGINNYVNLGSSVLTGATSLSVSVWLYIGLSDFSGTAKAYLDDGTGNPFGNGGGLVLAVDDRGGTNPTAGFISNIKVSTGNCVGFYASNIFSTRRWYHVVITYNGSNSTKAMYVDGVSKSVTGGSCGGSGNYVPRAANMYIGAANNNTLNFHGTIDDVRIYNRALSAQEVALLYASGSAHVADTASQSSVQAGTALLSKGLVGYWPLDGNTTNWTTDTTKDLSGNGNTGKVVSMSTTTSPVAGKIGQALKFNGSNYIEATDSATLRVGDPAFTFSAWVKPSSVSGCSSENCIIFNKENSYEWALSNDSTVAWAIANTSPGWAWETTGLTVPINIWTHIVITYDGSHVITYKNGGSPNSQTATGAVNNTGYQNALRIGARGAPGGGSAFFPGTIDDVRIYNRALSAQEVTDLYKLGSANVAHSNTVSLSSGLVGYWTFDGPSLNWRTNTAADSSGNGNTGTLVNMSTTSSPTAGKIGQALKFNGSSQYVSMGSAGVSATSFTYAAWVKAGTYSSYRGIVENDAGGTIPQGLWTENGLGITLVIGTGNGHAVLLIPVAKATLNTWHYIVGTANGTTYALYLDGVNVGATYSDTGYGGSPVHNAIGVGGTGGGPGYFSGSIDDVRIYNRALSAQEVAQLYALGH